METSDPQPNRVRAPDVRELITSTFGRRLGAHLGLVASALVAIYVALRFTAVSSFNTQTAAVLLHELGPTEAVVGTLIQGVPALIAASCALVMGWNAYLLFRESRQTHGLEQWLESAVFVVLLTFVPLIFVLAPVVLAIALGAWLGVGDRKTQSALEIRRSKRLILGTVAAVVASVLLASSTMWLPAESIIENKAKPFAGYILSTTGDQIVVLRHKDRKILRFPAASIKHELCEFKSWGGTPLLYLFSGDDRAEYQACPSR